MAPYKKRDGDPMYVPSRPAIAVDRVMHVGYPVAVVVADKVDIARDGADRAAVEYAPRPAVISAEAAFENGAPRLYSDCPSNEAYFYQAGDQAKVAGSIARGRDWLDQIVSGAAPGVEEIAARHKFSIRHVNMMISMAFIAPALVKAAVEGRLPRGIGVAALRDAPAEWSLQFQQLGLTRHPDLASATTSRSNMWPALFSVASPSNRRKTGSQVRLYLMSAKHPR